MTLVMEEGDWRSVLDIRSIPAAIPTSIQHVALISHRRHLACVGTDTLVVSTDWLAWREATRQGHPAVLLETMLTEWPKVLGDPAELYIRARQWGISNGHDVTLFEGVPLGSLFDRSVAMFNNAFARLWYGVDRVLERFHPSRVTLHGLRAEFDFISPDLQRQIVEDACIRHGCTFENSHDPIIDDDNKVELDIGVLSADAPANWRDSIRDMAVWLASLPFEARRRLAPRPEMLLWSNNGTALPLLEHLDSKKIHPIVIGRSMPKRLRLLWRWWCKGIVFSSLPNSKLNQKDTQRLQEIEDRLIQLPVTDIFSRAQRQFVNDHIIQNGSLRVMARHIKQWRAFFQRHRIRRVVIGDITNSLGILIASVARRHGAAIDELPNGMFVTPQRSPPRLPNHPGRLLDRMLGWGNTVRSLLDKQGAQDLPSLSIGYPALDGSRLLSRRDRRPPQERDARALVLPVYVDCDDSIGLRANIFRHLVDTVRSLKDAGYTHIRVKIHPALPNPAYYRQVLESEGLAVEFYCHGGLEPHLMWADFAVGPANSGSLVECMAADLPYYVVLPQPSMIDTSLLGPAIIVDSGSQLVRILDSGAVPDNLAILETIAGFQTHPTPCRRFWQVMEADLAAVQE